MSRDLRQNPDGRPSSFELDSSPAGRKILRAGRALQTSAFSVSQTALLGRDGSMIGSFSPKLEDLDQGRHGTSFSLSDRRSSETTLDRLLTSRSPDMGGESPPVGVALSTGLCPSASSFTDIFNTQTSSLPPSNTIESTNGLLIPEQLTPPLPGPEHESLSSLWNMRKSPTLSHRFSSSERDRSASGHVRLTDSPYSPQICEKFESSGNVPAAAIDFHLISEAEEDDDLHKPDSSMIRGRYEATGTILTRRGLMNIGFLLLLALGLLMLFAGYPVLTVFLRRQESKKGAYNLGGTNASGQVPSIPNLHSLIDRDTPQDAFFRQSADGRKLLRLVFSDEFNVAGRSFYPGDDPFWEAVDLNYWGTQNYEWYDPAAVTTKDGSLVITLSETPNHNLNFRGGMVSTWNKMCFTGGLIEVRAMLPGSPDISGTWPAAWTMGNLGRAGYGATTDGLWPYTYDSCDVGTLANQTYPKSKGGGPIAAETTGVYVDQYGPGLSYLPGQRLSRCTCPNSKDHPGPRHADGSFVGRSAPEIDIIEAQASNKKGDRGHVSMSLQLAPYDSGYNMTNTTGSYEFYDTSIGKLNSYTGSVYQQAASGLIQTDRQVYEDSGAKYETWGFEYKPGSEAGSYVTWLSGGEPVWRLNPMALGPNIATEVGQRLIPQEPMYVLLNLGISSSFTYVNWKDLHFPAKFRVDYVRIWQPQGEENVSCDRRLWSGEVSWKGMPVSADSRLRGIFSLTQSGQFSPRPVLMQANKQHITPTS